MLRRTFSLRRGLALSLAAVLAAWANLDLLAFHGLRAAGGASIVAPHAAGILATGDAAAPRVGHEASHQCAFTSVAHTTQTAPLGSQVAPLVTTERTAFDLVLPRLVPGRTASGLAPPV